MSVNYMVSIFMYLFLFSSLGFFLNYYSFLNSLLILESLSLFLLLNLIYLACFFFSTKMIMFYFIFVVSEGALGLTVLVKIVKNFGSNNFNSISLSLY